MADRKNFIDGSMDMVEVVGPHFICPLKYGVHPPVNEPIAAGPDYLQQMFFVVQASRKQEMFDRRGSLREHGMNEPVEAERFAETEVSGQLRRGIHAANDDGANRLRDFCHLGGHNTAKGQPDQCKRLTLLDTCSKPLRIL